MTVTGTRSHVKCTKYQATDRETSRVVGSVYLPWKCKHAGLNYVAS